MYLFAGFTHNRANVNYLYKLDLKKYVWSRADGLPHSEDYSDVDTDEEEGPPFQKKCAKTEVPPYSMPSRRDKLCGWTYGNRLFFFGGFGPRLDSDPTYMRDNGIWVSDSSATGSGVLPRGWNNQLLCFDVDTKKWSTIPTSGPRPLPRAAMCCAILGDRAFIFGGRHEATRRDDMISLNMRTFEWSPELVPPPNSERPSGRSWSSLGVVDRHLLFLYGGYDQSSKPLNDGFLFDVRDNRWTTLAPESLPNLGALPLAPTPALMEPTPRPATTSGLFWHTAVSLFSPPTAAATPGVYVFGGMLTPITQSETYHSGHLLHFAFKPKSLTTLALEHLAQGLTLGETHKLADDSASPKKVDHNRALEWIESCLPRPLPAVLRSRVEALISIHNMETEATRRTTQHPVMPPRPTDGAGGDLEVEDDSSDDDVEYLGANPHDDFHESDLDSDDSDDGYEPADQ